jgi:hypothetical protein
MNPETHPKTQAEKNPVYLTKSVMLFRLYGGVFVFSIITTSLSRSIPEVYRDMVDLLIALPIMGFFFMAPLGIYYSWKSYK